MVVSLTIIAPDELFDIPNLERVLKNSIAESSAAVKIDFEVTTRTFRRRPTFKDKVLKSGWQRKVSTDDEIYHFLDAGTKPHKIRPKNAAMLRFQPAYRAKTIVRKILSRQGGSSGPFVVAREVNHPGTDSRDFAFTIAKKWADEYPYQLQRAIDSELR